MEKCKPTRRHRCSFMTWISSQPCNYSKKRLLYFRWASFAKTTDTPMSGSAVKSHDWPKVGKLLTAKQRISYLLSFQGYLSVLKQFDFSNATTRIVGTRRTPGLWKQGCIKLIFRFSVRAEWRTSHQETGSGACNCSVGRYPCGEEVQNSARWRRRISLSRIMRTIRWQIFTGWKSGGRLACTRTQFSGIRLGTSCGSGNKIEDA